MYSRFTPTDIEQFSWGFGEGRAAEMFSTDDYMTALSQGCEGYDEALSILRGDGTPYRVGHLLGFFALTRDDDVPKDWHADVERWRVDAKELAEAACIRFEPE